MSGSELLPGRFANLALSEFSGERVLWSAAPDARGIFLVASLIWLFAVPWTIFSVFWEVMALSPFFAEKGPKMPDGLAAVFAIFGVPFVVIGICMMASPFYILRKAWRTVHVITDQRLATVIVGKMLEIESYRAGEIGPIQRSERPDGSGSLNVTVGRTSFSDGGPVDKIHQISGVPDVRRAEKLLLALKTG